MSNYTSTPINEIRLYLWQQLQSAGLMNSSDYYVNGIDLPLVPVIPSQQIPEFNNTLPGKPYVVYEVATLANSTLYVYSHDMIYFMVVSPDYDYVISVLNLMTDLFRRYDDTAKDMTGISSGITSSNFDYKYSMVESVNYPSPASSEGGFHVGHINVMVAYVRHVDSNNRF